MLRCKSGSGTNVAVTVTLPIETSVRRRVYQLIWSYSSAPTNGAITSTNLEGEELEFLITAAGPGGLPLPPIYGRSGLALTFTLAAGGSGIRGTLSVVYCPD